MEDAMNKLQQEECYKEVSLQITEREKEFQSGLNSDQKEFLVDLRESARWNWEGSSSYTSEFLQGINNQVYRKPSEFVEQKLGWMFPEFIYPRFKSALLYAVDHCNEWPYATGYYRRSFRCNTYYLERIYRMIYEFHDKLVIDADVVAVLTINLTEKETAYFQHQSNWNMKGCLAEAIAYELENENREVEQALTDIINGDSEVVLHREFIEGIVKSKNTRMHELLGRLLLAAKLQEGLRQVICETMDMGSIDAFRYLLGVIKENNLIRFSSVKRAIGTWLGLIDEEGRNLERISDKSIFLITECLEKQERVEEYLQSEDSMKIYVALWALAVHNTQTAIQRIETISEDGTHHQLLTAGYFCENLNNHDLSHRLAKIVIQKHDKDYNLLAVYLKYFMEDWKTSSLQNEKDENVLLTKYFEDEQEAECFYNIFWDIVKNIPKKSLTFSPCIFPWYEATLLKSDVIARLCVIAKILGDNKKIDETCQLIKDCDTNSRSMCLFCTLQHPKTSIQKKVATSMLCDKESWTREKAKEIVSQMKLEEENYRQMEDMLYYKAADMRSTLLEFLMKQSDEDLLGTIERLLSDSREEKRTAGLDLVMQLASNPDRIFTDCVSLVKHMEKPTSKEQILIDHILETAGEKSLASSNGTVPLLYQTTDAYQPEIVETAYYTKALQTFLEYFPESKLEKGAQQEKKGPLGTLKQLLSGKSNACNTVKSTIADCDSLHTLFQEHSKDEFTGGGGEIILFGNDVRYFREKIADYEFELPGLFLWKEWYEKNIKDEKRLFRMKILLEAESIPADYQNTMEPEIQRIFGEGFEKKQIYSYAEHMLKIVKRLCEEYVTEEKQKELSIALSYWYVEYLPQKKVLIPIQPSNINDYLLEAHYIAHSQLRDLFAMTASKNDAFFDDAFPLSVKVAQKTFARLAATDQKKKRRFHYGNEQFTVQSPYTYWQYNSSFHRPSLDQYLIAAYRNVISMEAMYEYLFQEENIGETLNVLSTVASMYREKGRQVAKRGEHASFHSYRKNHILMHLLGRKEVNQYDRMKNEVENETDYTNEEQRLLAFVDQIYEIVIRCVLSVELRRGDSETIYSKYINNIVRIYGLDYLVAILSALGKDKLERSTYNTATSKKGCLSHLLSVCIPKEEDAQRFRDTMEKTDISQKRLIETALYAPEWMNTIAEYLGWNGFTSACYYFMAHMNENFDNVKKAMIAKYSPLTEEELNHGAFDIDWFLSAYEALGKEKFDTIYDAAKYISDGAKHARARKYADAVLGRLDQAKTEIAILDKRNKDLVMAYALIPLKEEKDIQTRYLFLQNFLKESKKFGSQRIASEKVAVGIAMENLARNAGFTDVTRLTLRMENKIMDDCKEMFVSKEIEDVQVCLSVSDTGKVELICTKNGKTLKSIPAKLKKHDMIVELSEMKKKLTEQYRRTKLMFEQAMEDQIEFTVEEISMLHNNLVVCPIVKDLLFICDGKDGFLYDNKLVDYAGTETKLSAKQRVKVAHPFQLYQTGHWADYQKLLFEKQISQCFKQVFRELYIKAEEEKNLEYSRRYSGNQIQPQKTVTCLKQRRWVADVEDGLQKVFYKENIVARIYAMADWFTPADIEAPTLEWVEFSNRTTGERVPIADIPDILFSEVMRDVDLAVSVAHAGGVDPETSHSTVEMRAALLTYLLPMFKLTNVTIQKNHALVEGNYGTYSIHLGSGVIHKQGGAMINVLPVHSQHRGKMFLPFADDDPKTAEILTKVLLFAEDKKIKDPVILEQIR